MKVPERNSAEPGGKNAPFPAWFLRYASQPTDSPSDKRGEPNDDLADEQDYSELSHFEEVQASEAANPETAVQVSSAE